MLDTYFSGVEDMIREGDTCSPFAPCGRYPALVSIRAGSRLTFNTSSIHFDTSLSTTLLAQNVMVMFSTCDVEMQSSLISDIIMVDLQYWRLKMFSYSC